MPLLVIFGLMPVGLQVAYEGGTLSFAGRVLFLYLPVRKKQSPSGVERDLVSWFRNLLSRPRGKIFLKNAYTTLKRLIPRVRIPCLKLYVLAAGEDPANTALVYGAVGAAFEQLKTMTAEHVRKSDIRVAADFQRSKPEFTGCVLISLHLYQVLWYGLRFGLGFWRDYRRQRRGVEPV